MPRTVTAGRAHNISATDPEPMSSTPSRTVRRRGTPPPDTDAGPALIGVQTVDRGVAGRVSQVASIAINAAKHRGGATVHARMHRRTQSLHGHNDIGTPRRLVVKAWASPAATLPESQIRDDVGRGELRPGHHEVLDATAALFLRTPHRGS